MMKYSFLLILITYVHIFSHSVRAQETPRWWHVQSVDTMKYSRDMARQILDNPSSFYTRVDSQVAEIAKIGATHIALGTPYDPEFIPVLTLWVDAARRHHLSIWFRGNLAGWEGWFEYPRISRAEHSQKLTEFLTTHSDLFRSGDIFTPCPECENGGPGDPRMTGDVAGFRRFIIDEKKLSDDIFRGHSLAIETGYTSMNGDVARLIMDQDTTRSMGGTVSIDHYVKDPDTLASDIREIATLSGGKVILGEYGAPIPDIHGTMDEQQQAEWIRTSLSKIAPIPELAGINYWVSHGGSTALFDGETPRAAVREIETIFKPHDVRGSVVTRRDTPLAQVTIRTSTHSTVTDDTGTFSLPILTPRDTLNFYADGYEPRKMTADSVQRVILTPELPAWCLRWSFITRTCRSLLSIISY